ncbi:Uncharacterised protein [Capnocytophaga ochracea]|uniref:Uncharacterized protein n=1 Tax=Capnocytophaga ochracea TaxID=1018 RepID=A0A2X2SQ76_CAPOC|nr:Uncharacterised protein [Capnocytophaga ochracea]
MLSCPMKFFLSFVIISYLCTNFISDNEKNYLYIIFNTLAFNVDKL